MGCFVIDGLLNSYCDKEVRQSCGDTQGQLLSLWGLGTLLELDIRVRFRAIKNIKSRKIISKEFLSTWNFYDENGINVAEGLGEIGKV